jgi:hypothetical protein
MGASSWHSHLLWARRRFQPLSWLANLRGIGGMLAWWWARSMSRVGPRVCAWMGKKGGEGGGERVGMMVRG